MFLVKWGRVWGRDSSNDCSLPLPGVVDDSTVEMDMEIGQVGLRYAGKEWLACC